jgi:hypothetical protein
MDLDDIHTVLRALPEKALQAAETHTPEDLKKHVYARSMFHRPYFGKPMPVICRQVATLDELYSKRC